MLPSHQSQEFRNALALYDNGRYYASLKLFTEASILYPQEEQITRYVYLSREKLNQQLTPLLADAKNFTQNYPADFEQQRQKWLTILSLDRDNEDATHALKQISEQIQQLGTQERCEELQMMAKQSYGVQNLPLLNECYAEIQVLSQSNEFRELQPVMDEAVQNIGDLRNKLRNQLGKPNTYAITNQIFDDYKLAVELINVPYILDAANLPADPLGNYQRARNKFLVELDRLIEEELRDASKQEITNPEVALRTIENCHKLVVQHTTIQSSDLTDLKNYDDLVEKKEQLESVLDKFQTANQLFKNAQSETLFRQFQLYIQVKNVYPSYPQIEDRIQEVVSQVETILLHRLKGELQYVEDLLSQRKLSEAIATLESLFDEKNEDNKLIGILSETTEARKFYLQIPTRLHELREIERALRSLNVILEKSSLSYSDYAQALNYAVYLVENYSPCTILFQCELDLIIDGYAREMLDNTNPSQEIFLVAKKLFADYDVKPKKWT